MFIDINAQLVLDNPSFEGIHADATMPAGWFSASQGTTPDILPGYWGVYTEPEHGTSYVGIITRPDGSFESIQQRLGAPLLKDNCYRMSLSLAHSDNYAGYNKPLHLRIWLSDEKSARKQLIYKSALISHYSWKKYTFEFEPDTDQYYIILEAFISDSPVSYDGNILIDNISVIHLCNRA